MNLSQKNAKADMEIRPYQRLISLPVHAENVFHFPKGLPAFENVHDFIFLMNPDLQPFILMQALQPADIAFVCIDPFLIHTDYQPIIGEADRLFLRLDRPEDALVLSIVTIRKDEADTTANLHGPLVINIQSSIGKQILCEGREYPVRYRIMDAVTHLAAQQRAQRRDTRREMKTEARVG